MLPPRENEHDSVVSSEKSLHTKDRSLWSETPRIDDAKSCVLAPAVWRSWAFYGVCSKLTFNNRELGRYTARKGLIASPTAKEKKKNQ